MTQKETIKRNIGLTFDFVAYLMDNKTALETLPDNFKLEFKEKDFSKLERPSAIPRPVQATEKMLVRVRNAFDIAPRPDDVLPAFGLSPQVLPAQQK
jgi:hypothetical protein